MLQQNSKEHLLHLHLLDLVDLWDLEYQIHFRYQDV
jgi:hypothetical protein